MSEEDKIVTLEASQGKNEGEAIGSHNRSIVFLPRGTVPRKEVRVRLEPIIVGGEPKLDKNNRPMYRGLPAPDISSESWKDNGDSTVSKVSITTNWKGEAQEVGILETRALGKRESKEIFPNRVSKLIFGNDEQTSSVEISTFDCFYGEEEKVEDGKLVWKKTAAKREELVETVSHKIQKILFREDRGDIQNSSFKFQVSYKPGWTAHLKAIIIKPDGAEQEDVFMFGWQELPAWLQSRHEAKFPACACGRSRYDAQNADGYSKCEECRKQEVCVRCGKQTKVKNLAGRLVCSDCEAYEKAEQFINANLTAEMREAIAMEAKKLLAGQAMSGADGEAILRNTLDHLEDFARRRSIERWAKYNWYYFCEDGVYGCKLASAALQILQFLPQASGNGLVEMVAWIASQTRPDNPNWDYYLKSQVGETAEIPSFREDMLTHITIADRLRGSENDRIAATSGFQNLVERLGLEFPGMKEAAFILRDSKQDYTAALAKIREIEKSIARLASRESGAEQFDVSVCVAKPVPRKPSTIKRTKEMEEIEKPPENASMSEQTEGDDSKSAEDLINAMNSKWKKF